MNKLILGVDAGNHRAKVAGVYGVDMYRTAICDWFERDVAESFGEDDMEFEVSGRRGYAGSIAAYEDIYGGGMYGESKAHEDTLIRILLAISRYRAKYCPRFERFSIVTGQPIKTHKPDEKRLIADMLRGEHIFTVNGVKQCITIEEVGVAPEGSGAFWSSPQAGTVRIIDIGSGTVNCATIVDKHHINTASDTFNFGMETVGSAELGATARGIIRRTTELKWRNSDAVYVCGGVANEMLPFIKAHYPSARTVAPQLRRHEGVSVLHPIYANAVGFYELARVTYGQKAYN